MLLLVSHLLSFTVLAVNSLYDIFNNHDVPDVPALAGIAGGVILHGVYAWNISSMTPLYWCLGVGLAFSAYGWLAYWKGMWGGADAMNLSMLGFTAAGPVSGAFSFSYTLDILANFVLASLVITVGYSVYKFQEQNGSIHEILDEFRENEGRISAGFLIAGGLGLLLNAWGGNGTGFFIAIAGLIILTVFLKTVQENYMVLEKNPEEVEAGDVASPGQGFGKKIRGLTEEEAEEVSDSLEVSTGVPFIPVFLFALILTDLTASGFWLFYSFY